MVGSLEELERHGIEFVKTDSGKLWLKCVACGHLWAVKRGFSPEEMWTSCPNPYHRLFVRGDSETKNSH